MKKSADFCKKLDFVGGLLKIENGTAINLFWGVVTRSQSGQHRPKEMYTLIYYGRGDFSVCSELKYLLRFKDCYSRLWPVLLTPRLLGEYSTNLISSSGQNVWVFGGVMLLQALLLIIMREMTIMTKTITLSQSTKTKSKTKSIKTSSNQQPNQQNSCKKAVILMKSKSLEEDIRLKERMLELSSRHNLSVIAVIPVPHEYDAKALERLIAVIKSAKEQVTVITDNCEYIHRYNILGCAVLGTMVRFEHVQLVAYAHDMSGKLFLYFPNISNIKFFHIAEMNIWKLTNGDDIQVANKQLIQKQNGGN